MNRKQLFIFSILNLVLNLWFAVFWFVLILILSFSIYWFRVEHEYICMEYITNFLSFSLWSLVFILLPWFLLQAKILSRYNIKKKIFYIFFLPLIVATIWFFGVFFWDLFYYFLGCTPMYSEEVGVWYSFKERDINGLTKIIKVFPYLFGLSLLLVILYSYLTLYKPWKK